MPRPNPEVLTSTTTLNYRNRTTSTSTNTVHTKYYRTWSGSNSAGYPAHKVYNNHSTRMSKTLDFGQYLCDWRSPSSPEFAHWDGNCVLDAGTNLPSGCPYLFGNVIHDTSLQNKAINTCIDNIKDNKVNLAQMYAERKQVVDSILGTAERLSKAISALRRRRFQDALKHLGIHSHPKPFTRDLANNWLALQYGWKPLLSDVRNSAEALAQSAMGHPIRVKSENVTKRINPAWKGFDDQGNYGKFEWAFSEKTTVIKCKLEYEVTNDFARQGNKLSIDDPLTLAWELLPYSFVADWFLPVGDFLSRLNYDSGLTYMGGCLSSLTTQSSKITCVAGTKSITVGGNNTFVATFGGLPGRFAESRFDRVIYINPPRPDWPAFKDPFSVTHVTNAMALLRGSFKVK